MTTNGIDLAFHKIPETKLPLGSPACNPPSHGKIYTFLHVHKNEIPIIATYYNIKPFLLHCVSIISLSISILGYKGRAFVAAQSGQKKACHIFTVRSYAVQADVKDSIKQLGRSILRIIGLGILCATTEIQEPNLFTVAQHDDPVVSSPGTKSGSWKDTVYTYRHDLPIVGAYYNIIPMCCNLLSVVPLACAIGGYTCKKYAIENLQHQKYMDHRLSHAKADVVDTGKSVLRTVMSVVGIGFLTRIFSKSTPHQELDVSVCDESFSEKHEATT